MTPTVSCSTATSRAPRAASSPQILRPRYFFTGSRCAGRSASAATCRRSPAEEADAYFATRPKQAQIGAWASKQSQPLESRFAFEQAIAKVAAKYVIGEVPRPPGWSGWRIAPLRFEFWHDRPFRLHDRIEFSRETPGAAWTKTRLYP